MNSIKLSYWLFIITLFLSSSNCFSQAFQTPSWFNKPPHGTYSGVGEDSNLETALLKAKRDALQNVQLQGQLTIDSKGRVLEGNIQIGHIRTLKKDIQKIGNSNRVYVLFSIDIGNNLTNPFFAGTYSALLPGGGQLYKQYYGKSVMFFLGTAGLVTGALVMNNQADDAYRISRNNSSLEDKRNNQQLGDDYILARNIFIGTAGVLYLYNIFDAAFSEHRPRYDLSINYKNDNFQLNLAMEF